MSKSQVVLLSASSTEYQAWPSSGVDTDAGYPISTAVKVVIGGNDARLSVRMDSAMEQQLEDLRLRLAAISEELGDLSITVLRDALESGADQRPPLDKVLGRVRRSVDKAAALIEREAMGLSADE